MINALHLTWIIPSTFIFGFMFAALFQTEKREDERNSVLAWKQGLLDLQTKKREEVVENMPFYGWEDDIVTNL